MEKINKSIIAAFILSVLCLFALSAQAKYNGGSGDPCDPYQINDPCQLNAIGTDPCDWDKHFILTADIVLGPADANMVIIGNNINPFEGRFDGNNHTISNLTLYLSGRDVALFGCLDSNGEVCNLGLVNVDISGENFVGGLVGTNNGLISGCYVMGGRVIGKGEKIGGLVGHSANNIILDSYTDVTVEGCEDVGGVLGYSYQTEVLRCNSSGDVNGYFRTGGLAGTNNRGRISHSYSTSHVQGEYNTGGLVGQNYEGEVFNCYACGEVFGSNSVVGGLIGFNKGHCIDYSFVINCYSTCNVTGTESTGGLIGTADRSKVYNCFWDIEAAGIEISKGGLGLPTALMKKNDTYAFNGWDGSDWTIEEGHYPCLAWQTCPGTYITIPEVDYEGSGDPNDPYLIETAAHLQLLSLRSILWDKSFILTQDIDMQEVDDFHIIGNYYLAEQPFTGRFDGNNHIISNLTLDQTDNSYSYVGLFGRLGAGGGIRNLGLTNVNISGDSYVGALVGQSEEGIISNCYTDGVVIGVSCVGGLAGGGYDSSIMNCHTTGIISGESDTGGIMGRNWMGIIFSGCYSYCAVSGTARTGGLIGMNNYSPVTDCYTTGNVTGGYEVGGLVGDNHASSLSNCYALGDVTGQSHHVGGLVGKLDNSHTEESIINCYATGTIQADTTAGGLVGYSEDAFISQCYAVGNVECEEDVAGGLVGYNSSSTISECYAEGDATGERYVGGLVGENRGSVTICYARGSASGSQYVGGFCGVNNGAKITNCYSTGRVSGSDYIGAFSGYNNRTLKNCFWDIETSQFIQSDGGLGLPTALMQKNETYAFNSWVGSGWIIEEGNYPCLSWNSCTGTEITIPEIDYEGSGDINDPYIIESVSQLHSLGLRSILWGKHFILAYDIDCNDVYFYPIGNDAFDNDSFTGTFNGNFHVLFNITIDKPDSDNTGLFSHVGPTGKILNLSLDNVHIAGNNKVGALASQSSGEISGCHAMGDVNGLDEVGGLIGSVENGSINNCSYTGRINASCTTGGLIGKAENAFLSSSHTKGELYGSSIIGGLVGYSVDTTILNSYSKCTVFGINDKVGGLVGYNSSFHSTGQILNSYAKGNVEAGDEHAGGLVAYNTTIIKNCYAIGSVTGDSIYGGLVGYNRYTGEISNCYSTGYIASIGRGLVGQNFGTVLNSFWDILTSNQNHSNGGTGLETWQMQLTTTYIAAGWDFLGETGNGNEDIWDICEGTNYPKLYWQFLAGDFVCPDGVDLADFAVLADTWSLPLGQAGYNDLCDLVDDDIIDLNDLAVFAENWLEGK